VKKALLAVAVGLFILSLVVVYRVRAAKNARAAAAHGGDRPLPVRVATAEIEDVPVVVVGLGAVTPLYTVTVRTLVDGRLDKVFFTEGQHVKPGDPLALVDPRPFAVQLQQATAARAKDDATRRDAEITLERDIGLLHAGLASQQQVDDQRAAAAAAAAAVKQDEAQMSGASLNVDYAHINSPIDGVTGMRLVDPGNVVHAVDPGGLVVVTQLDPISVVFTLPEDDLAEVAAAQSRGKPPVTILSRDGANVLARGDLTVIDNQVSSQTATIRLRAVMKNPNRTLWPQEFVKAQLQLDVRRGALVVPAVAVQRGPNGTFVYVVDKSDTAVERDVSASEVEGDRAIVTKGLERGERVVVEGQDQIKPGAKVAPQTPKDREAKR